MRAATSMDQQNLCSSNSTLFHFKQCLICHLQSIFLIVRFDVCLCRQLQKFTHILPCYVRNALDLFFHPQLRRIIQFQQDFFIGFFFANGIDDQSAAGTQNLQRFMYWTPSWCGVNDRIQTLKWILLNRPRPSRRMYSSKPTSLSAGSAG